MTGQQLRDITQEGLEELLPKLLALEPAWTQSGETLWTKESMGLKLEGKFSGLSKAIVSDSGEVMGYFVGSMQNDCARLHKIVTGQEFRGQGIGKQLWKSFVDECKLQGAKKIEFKVLTDNVPAINLYKSQGCVFNGHHICRDSKSRYDITYVINTPRISHSLPCIDEEDISAATRFLENKDLVNGKVVDSFISEVGKLCDKKYGVAVNSGTTALTLALKSIDAKGKEVILPSYVCGSVLHAVENAGARPVLADISDKNYNLSLADTKRRLTPNTRAIVLPHMFGSPASLADTLEFRALGPTLIEDCAQSIGMDYSGEQGERTGSIGDIAVFSFNATKPITALNGGMVLTNNQETYRALKSLTNPDRREIWDEAYNCSMNNINAAIGLNQLEKLEYFLARRKLISEKYNKLISSQAGVQVPEHPGLYRYILTVKPSERDSFIDNLRTRGIDATKPVYHPLHQYKGLPSSEFPNTFAAHNSAVSIPFYPALTFPQVKNIAGIISNWRIEK